MRHRAKSSKKKRADFRQTLFWDVNIKTLDPKKNARYIIERILDFGNEAEVKWMCSYYPHELIKEVLNNSRAIHEKSRNLWKLIFS